MKKRIREEHEKRTLANAADLFVKIDGKAEKKQIMIHKRKRNDCFFLAGMIQYSKKLVEK